MKKEEFRKKIIRVEIIGFLIAIIISWLDEFLDRPHIFLEHRRRPSITLKAYLNQL